MADLGVIATRIASVALMDTNKRNLRDLQPNSAFLLVIGDEFSKMLKENAFRIHSFQESRGISGVRGLNGKVCLALHSTVIFVINTLFCNL